MRTGTSKSASLLLWRVYMSCDTCRFEGHVRKDVGIHDGGSTNEINFPKPVIASLGTDMYIQESRLSAAARVPSRGSRYLRKNGRGCRFVG